MRKLFYKEYNKGVKMRVPFVKASLGQITKALSKFEHKGGHWGFRAKTYSDIERGVDSLRGKPHYKRSGALTDRGVASRILELRQHGLKLDTTVDEYLKVVKKSSLQLSKSKEIIQPPLPHQIVKEYLAEMWSDLKKVFGAKPK